MLPTRVVGAGGDAGVSESSRTQNEAKFTLMPEVSVRMLL